MTGQVIDFNGFLMKTDTDGNLVWQQFYAADGNEHLSSLCSTNDEGYLLTGWRESNSIHNGALWMVKTNGTGTKQWEQTFDGTGFEYSYGKGCFQTSDGGYIMCGNTDSYGAGLVDAWVIKTDASGNEVWNRTYGYTRNDYTWCMSTTSDGDYVLAICKDYMYNSGTKDDIWIVKINETGGTEWSYLIEEAGVQIPTCIQQTDDSGFIVSGRTEEYGVTTSDGIVIKIESIAPPPQLNLEVTGGLGVTVTITNSGLGDAIGVPWEITVKGGILGRIDKTVNGTIDIPVGGSKTVETGMLFGLGPITITAKVADVEQTATGKQFIIFSLVK
jgi:hypothetical protein